MNVHVIQWKITPWCVCYTWNKCKNSIIIWEKNIYYRYGSRTTATFKMELFVTLVNGFHLLTNVPNSPVLDVAVVLDTPLNYIYIYLTLLQRRGGIMWSSKSKQTNVARSLFLNSFWLAKLQNVTKVYINGFSKISKAMVNITWITNHALKLR